jgi:hypothetical protein
MVQKGKFAASALLFDNALNSVDFPTFGNPTIPHLSPITKRKLLKIGRKYRTKGCQKKNPQIAPRAFSV